MKLFGFAFGFFRAHLRSRCQ